MNDALKGQNRELGLGLPPGFDLKEVMVPGFKKKKKLPSPKSSKLPSESEFTKNYNNVKSVKIEEVAVESTQEEIVEQSLKEEPPKEVPIELPSLKKPKRGVLTYQSIERLTRQ